MINRSKLDR